MTRVFFADVYKEYECLHKYVSKLAEKYKQVRKFLSVDDAQEPFCCRIVASFGLASSIEKLPFVDWLLGMRYFISMLLLQSSSCCYHRYGQSHLLLPFHIIILRRLRAIRCQQVIQPIQQQVNKMVLIKRRRMMKKRNQRKNLLQLTLKR